MIVNLRKKVFWSILLSTVGVLFVLMLAIDFLNYTRTASKEAEILDLASDLLGPCISKQHKNGGKHGWGKGKMELLRSVSEDELGILLLDNNGIIRSVSGCADRMETDQLQTIADAAVTDRDGEGHSGDWSYRRVGYEEGAGVLLLNTASLRAENEQTILLSLLAFVIAVGLFALLARFLADTIVKPVDENMKAQKRFVADASHELKTPLTVIDANISVLEQSLGQNKWLGYIKDQSERMAGLISDLLQLSRLDESKYEPIQDNRESYDASEAVLAAALPFESLAYEQGLTMETELPETLMTVGNPEDLAQITSILVDNAIKHAWPGSVIGLSLTESSIRYRLKEERRLVLKVSNTGDKIPPEALDHLFDRFYLADFSRAYKDKSFGLGLAIARGLAEKNKGTISAESKDGYTVFTLVLPRE